MNQELTEQLKVIVAAEVDSAIKNFKRVDAQTSSTEKLMKSLGKTMASVFSVAQIIKFAQEAKAAYEADASALSVLNATIKATGAAAWTSSRDLESMASQLQSVTNYAASSIEEMQSVLLGFKNIRGDEFAHATNAILDMATVMRMDLSSAAQAVGKALDDPINGITSLQRQGFRFGEAQKAVIESLVKTGEVAQAQKLILDELDTSYGGAAQAAATGSQKIRNAWNDMLSGVGSFVTQLDGKLGLGDAIAGGLESIGNAARNAFDWISELVAVSQGEDAYANWYKNLDDLKKLEVATRHYTELKAEYARKETQDTLDELSYWFVEIRAIEKRLATEQELVAIENDRLDNANAMSELMHDIATEYDGLAKSDPLKQLEAYEQKLTEIAEQRKKLTGNTDAALDVSGAISQLDYIDKVIRERMAKLNGEITPPKTVKSWVEYIEEITGVSAKNAHGGKIATDYITKINDQVNRFYNTVSGTGFAEESLDKLNAKIEKIQSTVEALASIDPTQIDEYFSAGDNSITTLNDELQNLLKQKQKLENKETLEWYAEQVFNIGKTEAEITLEKFKQNGAEKWQLEQLEHYLKKLEEAREDADNLKEAAEATWQTMLQDRIAGWSLFSEGEKSIAGLTAAAKELGVAFANLGINSLNESLRVMGKAFGEGENFSDSFGAALKNLAQTILDQLPTMMINAGLNILPTNPTLAWALIGAGLTSSFVGGLAQGWISDAEKKAEKNALGGVYGDGSVEAFAAGGTFTNRIVSSPTLFRFARGSGFGTGLMGEAGPEAIMPLKRAADGSLGVIASGSGGNITTVVIHNYSGSEVETSESDGPGGKNIEVIIGRAVNSVLSNGSADRVMAARYGLRVRGV